MAEVVEGVLKFFMKAFHVYRRSNYLRPEGRVSKRTLSNQAVLCVDEGR